MNRLFDLRPGERRQAAFLFGVSLLLMVGLFWVKFTIGAALVGREKLIDGLLYSGITTIALSLGYIVLVDRVPKARLLLLLTVSGLVAGGVFTVGLVTASTEPQETAALLALYVLYLGFFIYIWTIHWWSYLLGLFDTQAAKRVSPVVGTARPLAYVVVFFLISLDGVIPALGAADVVAAAWTGLLFVVLLLVLVLPRVVSGSDDGREPVRPREARRGGPLASMVEGFRFVAQSGFLRWLALASLLMTAVNTLIYELSTQAMYDYYAAQGYADPVAGVKTLTANLDAGLFFLLMFVQLFFLGRIVRRVGLGVMNLLHPFMTLVVSLLLILTPLYPESLPLLALSAAALAYINRDPLRRTFRDPITTLMYNAVPVHIKSRARAVVIGIIAPLGMVITALAVKAAKDSVLASGTVTRAFQDAQLQTFAYLLLGGAALLYVIAAFVLRREYTQAMVTMLQAGSFNFLLSHRTEMNMADSLTIRLLEEQLQTTADPDMKAFIVSILAEIAGTEAVPILTRAFVEADASLRPVLVESLVNSPNCEGEQAAQFLTNRLGDFDALVRGHALTGLRHCHGADSPDYHAAARELLADPDVKVRAAALPPLLVSPEAEDVAAAESALADLLNADNADHRAAGIKAVNTAGRVDDVRALIPLLDDRSDTVRLAATEAITALWGPDTPADIEALILARVETLLDDPVERVRLAELALLEHIDSPEAQQTLINALADPSCRVRRTAVAALVARGQGVVPALEPLLDDANTLQRRMASAALAQLQPDRYRDALEAAVDDVLDSVYANRDRVAALETCRRYPSVGVIRNALRDEIERQGEELHNMLSTLHTPDAVDVIWEKLPSLDSRVRANAVEALESLTSPALARRIAPLFAPEQEEKPKAVALGRLPQPFPVLLEIATGGDTWLRAVTLFAFGEIGLAHPGINEVLPRHDGVIPDAVLTVTSGTRVLNPCEATIDPRALVIAIRASIANEGDEIRVAARAALRLIWAQDLIFQAKQHHKEGGIVLSTVERMILLKKVSFFQNLSVDQLRVLAGICDEVLFHKGDVLFNVNDPGAALYVVANGKVRVGIPSRTTDAFTELAVFEANTAFGEMSLFDPGPRSASAVAAEDTLTLRLSGDLLRGLIVQNPELSLEMIHELVERVREMNNRIAALSSTVRKGNMVVV